MNLSNVAHKAATDASAILGAPLSKNELAKVAEIIAKAMENAVREASTQHATVCCNYLSHDQDMAHKIQKEIEQKKIALIANLSSFR